MKTTLKASVLLNLGLLGSLVYILAGAGGKTGPGTEAELSPQTAPAGLMLEARAPPAPAGPAAQAASNTFRWSQIESSDYRVYVANLRATGCPERTVRDIILADVDGLYAEKRRQLRLDEAGAGPWSRPEEAQFVAGLLGQKPSSSSSTAQAAEAVAVSNPSLEAAPSLPLVLRTVDIAALDLDAGQEQAIEELREQFIARIGGPGQNPADPAYRDRWQQAQPEIDEMLKGMIGINAFQNYELEAAAANPGNEPAGKK